MKKILLLLSSITISSLGANSVIACGETKFPNSYANFSYVISTDSSGSFDTGSYTISTDFANLPATFFVSSTMDDPLQYLVWDSSGNMKFNDNYYDLNVVDSTDPHYMDPINQYSQIVVALKNGDLDANKDVDALKPIAFENAASIKKYVVVYLVSGIKSSETLAKVTRWNNW